ncbi:hypothetical protein QJS10_CPB18g00564 [Acorus calamus]|uniref:Uncharacterized protein n=1 Tax=Acorus calamus TaxID=4465 RepID=A0AAV9CRH4_ACOCL|nr:hypothetical protein QJS10_CPB18g00564 [Acorus calamus]
MALVDRIPEITVDSPLYFYALDMLHEPGNREGPWPPELQSKDEIFPPSGGLKGDPAPSRASSSDESQMSTIRDAICNEIAAARGNARWWSYIWVTEWTSAGRGGQSRKGRWIDDRDLRLTSAVLTAGVEPEEPIRGG